MLSGRPCVGKASAVVIADDIVFVTLGCRPAGPRRSAIWKMPGQQKGVTRIGARGNIALQAQCAGSALFFGFRSKLPVRSEIVPKERRTGPPFGRWPAAKITHSAITCIQHRERERSVQRVSLLQFRIAHVQALKTCTLHTKFVDAPIASNRTIDRESYRNLRRA